MNREQLAQLISQIPPSVILALFQMFINTPPEQLKQIIAELEQAAKQETQGGQQAGQSGNGEQYSNDMSDTQMAQQNLYGTVL